ncbi:MAG: hypothetical protein ACRYG7_03675 [Janthinobacterium lividum]
MYTPRRLRYATRWNRRLAFIVAILLLLALGWRAYKAWQREPQPEPAGRLV